MSVTKQGVRERLLRERKALGATERSERSQRVVDRLRAMPAYRNASSVAAYIAFLNEVDVAGLMTAAAEEKKRVYLPRLLDNGSLEFAPYHPNRLVAGPRGVMQPAPEIEAVSLEQLELVVVPGLAFDRHCQRLGLGAGFYDKTLAGHGTPDGVSRLTTVGAAFDFQIVDELPTDEWDVPLHAVVSESEVIS